MKSERSNDSFVDEMSTGLTGKPNKTPEEITDRMNILAGNYDKYLNLSGGRLAIHKCLWYLVAYKIKVNIIYPITKKESPHLKVLIVEAFSGEKVEIKRLDPSESHTTLGVFLAMGGNQKREITFLKDKDNILLTFLMK